MKKSSSKRIDFKSGVPEIIAKNAGFKCSVPRCKNSTVGPFYESEGVVNMGTACHIYSASKNGPRGWGNKNEEFISSEKNGIWCCQYHGNLIDKNKGNDYPVSVLFMWKKLAEAKVLKQMNDTLSPLGWVESIEFTKFIHNTLPKINLSRFTIISGRNGSGKTSLLEIMASISNSKYAERFNNKKINAKIIYSTVDTFSKELNLSVLGTKLLRTENRTKCLLPPGDLEVIYCNNQDINIKENEDDIDFLMRVLNIDKSTLFSLTDIGTKTLMAGEIKFQKTTNEEDELYYQLNFKFNNSDDFIPFHGLSTSEKSRLILDLQITKAREIAKQRLTVLLIEDLARSLDDNNFKNLLKALEEEEFQVIVSLPPYREDSTLNVKKGKPTLYNCKYLKQWKLAFLD